MNRLVLPTAWDLPTIIPFLQEPDGDAPADVQNRHLTGGRNSVFSTDTKQLPIFAVWAGWMFELLNAPLVWAPQSELWDSRGWWTCFSPSVSEAAGSASPKHSRGDEDDKRSGWASRSNESDEDEENNDGKDDTALLLRASICLK